MENKKEKKERIFKVGEAEYRRLKRRDAQLMRIKNHLRIAWDCVRKVEEVK